MRRLNWLLPALTAVALNSPASAELLGPSPSGVTATAGSTATSAGFSGSIIDQVGLSGGCPPAAPALPATRGFSPRPYQECNSTSVRWPLGSFRTPQA